MGTAECTSDRLVFRPVTIEEWLDLQALFSEPGVQQVCWCMHWRTTRSEFQQACGEPNRRALERIVAAGQVPGVLARLGERPVGWCSVAPREDFPSLDRSPTLKRVDAEPVWSIVCFFVARQYRRRGIAQALILAAVGYARSQGARIVEAYPLIPRDTGYTRSERYTGVLPMFQEVGFK